MVIGRAVACGFIQFPERMSAYRQTILQNHFRLRDSERIALKGVAAPRQADFIVVPQIQKDRHL